MFAGLTRAVEAVVKETGAKPELRKPEGGAEAARAAIEVKPLLADTAEAFEATETEGKLQVSSVVSRVEKPPDLNAVEAVVRLGAGA